jgi:hypothetical protein
LPKSKKRPAPPSSPQSELVEAFDQRPAGHTHTFGLIRIFINLVLSATGYRAAARALEIVVGLLPSGGACSANGGQFWLLRLGLYELTRPKQQANDWVWIIDHTIQTGNGKCFLVVGVRLSAWNTKRLAALKNAPQASFALQHQDLTVFEIERMDSSTGEAVHRQLEQLSQQTGITPCCILSDQGADVRGAAQRFCQADDRTTVVVHDIAHAVANALKRQLNKNPAWEQFLADANRSKTAVRQTPYAFLMPPELKNKARWMNLQPLIDWSRRVERFLRDPQAALARAKVPVDLDHLHQKMGWLHQHADSISRWATMLEVAAITLKYIRNHGYHRRAHQKLRGLLANFRGGPAWAMAEEILVFVKTQCESCGGRRLLGSSEVIESLIGKGKQLMGRNRNGYTKTVLAMAAAAVDVTNESLANALAKVQVQDVKNWTDQKLGLSLQAQRQRTLLALPGGTKIG